MPADVRAQNDAGSGGSWTSGVTSGSMARGEAITPEYEAKLREAEACADAMDTWWMEHRS